MQRNFQELRKFLDETYPGALGEITAEQYPPPPMAVMAVQVAGVAQFATIGLLLAGDGLFKTLGFATPPEWYGMVKENKMLTFGAVWMANNLAAQGVATGAFEIDVGGIVVYSKLATGKLPSANDITNGMKRVGLAARAIDAF
mmetsp:Transcript_28615/g.96344  ORF Transcript_28615/g.96344 Transcript_28615/m.96344 type:complete len:143 (+) Transcript_28615:349-777(+)